MTNLFGPNPYHFDRCKSLKVHSVGSFRESSPRGGGGNFSFGSASGGGGGRGRVGGVNQAFAANHHAPMRGGGGPPISSRGATHGMNLKQARGALMRMKSQAPSQNYGADAYDQHYGAYGGGGGGYDNYYSAGNGYPVQNQYEQFYPDNSYPANYYQNQSAYPNGMEYGRWPYSSAFANPMHNNGNSGRSAFATNYSGSSRGSRVGVGAGRGGGKGGGAKGRGRGKSPRRGKGKGGVGQQAASSDADSKSPAAGRGTILKGREEEEAAAESKREEGNQLSDHDEDDEKLKESWAEQIEDFVKNLENE